jgi:threonylcarbamoyladenosine tRNA methylthiotransferase MtaB
MKKAAIVTLGCKVNQVESSSIVQQLEQRGYEIVNFDTRADIYIINTCTVTNRTDYKSRNLIRKALKAKATNPQVKVIVTGCYAQKEIEEIKALGNVDLIVDNQNKINLDIWFDNTDYAFHDIMQSTEMQWLDIDVMHERTRAFIKIQDGCDYFCTYCAVPYGRGKSRSLPASDVIRQTEKLIEKGYKEIVLTGVNLGLYNDAKAQVDLSNILKALVEKYNTILFRISSVEPDLWNDGLIRLVADNTNICPHFHIPLQSGSDAILQKMSRHYDTKLIIKLINRLKEARPDCAIGLDVICGFPGETDKDFELTFELIKSLPVAYLHVFNYSPRKGTPASVMPNQVDSEVAKLRVDKLIKLGMELKKNYINDLIVNKTMLRGIVESIEDSVCSSLSDHYIRLYKKDSTVSANDLIEGIALKKYKDGISI